MARKAGRIWRQDGAIEYRECAGADLNVKSLISLAYGGFKVFIGA
jgi:hypothetical protein